MVHLKQFNAHKNTPCTLTSANSMKVIQYLDLKRQ